MRARVQDAQRKAAQIDKKLSANEIAAIVSASPGIVQQLTAQTPAATPQPEPQPRVTPQPVPQQQAGLAQCGSTEQQTAFPCRLVVGGIAEDRRALRDVRANVQLAQRRAQANGRSLSATEIAQIVADTPGILVERAPDGGVPGPEQPAAVAAGREAEQVVTEEITTGQVRSSDQEFDTAVGATGQDSGGGGLSKFEKALLLGLGAVAVGSVLRNGDQIVSRTGDRMVLQDPQGNLRVLKDDDALIRRPGDEVQTQTFNDGSTRTIIEKGDGTRVVTIRGRDGAVLRRVNVDVAGNEYVLFDDTQAEQDIVVSQLPQARTPTLLAGEQNEAALRAALAAELSTGNQRFSLRQVREIAQVRALAPELELDAVRFQTGSAAIRPEQARALARIGTTLSNMIARDPGIVILVEGHTDAVGDATYNLALSDRRAETVALALTEYFRVPPGNLITQGYGEAQLKVPTAEAEAANRRAVVRNITGLLR